MRRRFCANDFYWIYVYALADALCGCRYGTASIKTANLEYEIVRRHGAGGAGKSFFQSFRSAGTLPPFAASLFMTWRCSQMFMLAESFVSPV